MTIRIAHLCEHAFNGGALASLKQIRMGINTLEPKWLQDVVVSTKKDVDKLTNPEFFEQDAIYVHYDNLNKFLKSYDLVMIHKLMNTNVGKLITYIPRTSCKVVVVSHTFSVNPSNCLVGRPDLCICVSEHMKKTFQKLNPKVNFTTIHNAVSSQWIKSKINDKGSGSGLIGRSNALNAIKYSKKFTEWFCSRKFSRPFVMEYLGGGSSLEEARSYAKSMKSHNAIDFKGNIVDDAVRYSIMSSWEFFLYDINLPEGTSMSILESLAMGVPVICSNKPGNNEIIKPGINGYIFNDLENAGTIIDELLIGDKLESLKLNCANECANDSSFIKMSEKYVDSIKKVNISNNGYNLLSTKSPQSPQVSLMKNVNDKNKLKDQESGSVLKGNRHVALPTNYRNAKENLLTPKKKTEHKTEKDKPRTLDTATKKNKDHKLDKDNNKKKNEKKSGNRPLASSSFVEDVMKKIESAPKVFTGPKFSILSATFNKGRYLEDLFNSISLQSYRPLEVVIVDDCSEDSTQKLVNEYRKIVESKDIELKYIRNSSQKGCAKSYRIALEAATGEYFGVLDSDDALMHDAVSIVMARYLSNSKISFIWSQYIRCNHDMTMVGSGISRQVPQRPPQSMLEFESHTRRVHCYSHWRTMKKMDNMYDVFDCPYSSSVDKFMGYMLEELGHGHFLNVPLYKYRGSVNDGLTATSSQRNNWEKIRSDAKRRRVRSRKKVFSVIV